MQEILPMCAGTGQIDTRGKFRAKGRDERSRGQADAPLAVIRGLATGLAFEGVNCLLKFAACTDARLGLSM